jgi:hypothetical protein
MPVIRVSDATFDRLKAHAVPLEDSASDVIERVLDGYEECFGAGPFGNRSTHGANRGNSEHEPDREFWRSRRPACVAISDVLFKMVQNTSKEPTQFSQRWTYKVSIPICSAGGRRIVDCEPGKRVTYVHVYPSRFLDELQMRRWADRLKQAGIGSMQKSGRFRISFVEINDVDEHRALLGELFRDLFSKPASQSIYMNQN